MTSHVGMHVADAGPLTVEFHALPRRVGAWTKLGAALKRASGALRRMPAYAGLDAWAATEDHRTLLQELFMACTGGGNDSLPGFGPARCTKMLHKKRPALIPIVDSWQLQAWGKRTDPWSTADMVEVVFAIQGFMAAQMPEFADLGERLKAADPSLPQLSAIRLYDILFWEMSRAAGASGDAEATSALLSTPETEDDLSPTQTSIHCARSLRDAWPDPLASQWRVAYPQLFDDDDLRLTVTQGWTHFWEWFAAVHVYETTGARSLVEKYGCRTHPGKLEPYELLLSEQERAILDAICGANHVQSPDLLIYEPDMTRYWFAEVKGPGDRLSAKQRASHAAIERELGVPVQVIRVIVDEGV